jgi:hypothetical protein
LIAPFEGKVMRTITADAALIAVLRQATGLTELRDAEGNVVGFFAPVSVDRAPLYAQAAADISPADVKRRKEEGGKTHTTPEVLRRLDALETS